MLISFCILYFKIKSQHRQDTGIGESVKITDRSQNENFSGLAKKH